MGKKRIATKSGKGVDHGKKNRSLKKVPRKRLESGVLNIEATFNNTKVSLADTEGNIVMWSSSGALGFGGARKSTPYAAAKVGELLAEKAAMLGMKEAKVVIRGVGAGRESALRGFASQGINVTSIKDATPVPHNGPRAPKPRRV